MPVPVEILRMVMLLQRIEGRDKLTKAAQYLARLALWADERNGNKGLPVIARTATSLSSARSVMRLGRFTYVWLPLIKQRAAIEKQGISLRGLFVLVTLCVKCSSDFAENMCWVLRMLGAPETTQRQCKMLNARLYFLACIFDWSITSEKMSKGAVRAFLRRARSLFKSAPPQAKSAASAANRGVLSDIKEETESTENEPETPQDAAAARVDAQRRQRALQDEVNRARVKFVKVTADVISSGSGVGLFSQLPRPVVMASSLVSALCVIRLELIDIERKIEERVAAKRPGDFVRDRSAFS